MSENTLLAHVHKVLIVDDEPAARYKLAHFLKDYEAFKVVAQAKNGIQALEYIEEFKPDLMFLDIQMPKLDGIAVASNMELNADISIVFVTGFSEYAIKAFELNAVDYLLKPYDKPRLAKTINRFLTLSAKNKNIDIPKLVQDYRAQIHFPSTLLFNAEGSIEVVEACEIQWIESSGNYIKICLERTAFIARQTLIGAQSQLDPSIFVRIHRSHIININEIIRVNSIGKGDHALILKSGTELKLSRAYAEAFFVIFATKNATPT
ncbi:MAG: lytTr DNA-binding response regulator [Osedax symbiont Rs2]|nr:MAG: lytTr DNA-binding response regulator [Osedax symbiont Rs2]